MRPCPPTPSPPPPAAWIRTSACATPNCKRRASPRRAALAVDKVRELIRANTDAASLGILGEPGVNVLPLNLALDALAAK